MKYMLLATTKLKNPVTCVSWSPKGKQLIVGDTTGALSQFKPALSVVRVVPPPPPSMLQLSGELHEKRFLQNDWVRSRGVAKIFSRGGHWPKFGVFLPQGSVFVLKSTGQGALLRSQL